MSDVRARLSGDFYCIYSPRRDLWWTGYKWSDQLSYARVYSSYESAARAPRSNAELTDCTIVLVEARVQVDGQRAMEGSRRLAMKPPARGLFG